jgi:hypothetical protein
MHRVRLPPRAFLPVDDWERGRESWQFDLPREGR